MYVDRVADANAEEWPGDLPVERPVSKRGAFGQPSFDFDAQQIDADSLRVPLRDWGRQVSRLARDIGFDKGLRCRQGRDDELTLHAGKLVPRDAAKIGEVAGLRRPKSYRGACPFSGDTRRPGVLLGKDDIVLRSLAVDQGELHDLSCGGGQHRIYFAVDLAADTDIDHASFGDARSQGIFCILEVAGPAAGRVLLRLTCCP